MIGYNSKAYGIIIEAPIDPGNGNIINGLYNVYFDIKFSPYEIAETLHNFFISNNKKNLDYIEKLKTHLNNSKYKDNFLIEFFL